MKYFKNEKAFVERENYFPNQKNLFPNGLFRLFNFPCPCAVTQNIFFFRFEAQDVNGLFPCIGIDRIRERIENSADVVLIVNPYMNAIFCSENRIHLKAESFRIRKGHGKIECMLIFSSI